MFILCNLSAPDISEWFKHLMLKTYSKYLLVSSIWLLQARIYSKTHSKTHKGGILNKVNFLYDFVWLWWSLPLSSLTYTFSLFSCWVVPFLYFSCLSMVVPPYHLIRWIYILLLAQSRELKEEGKSPYNPLLK